MNGRRSRVPLLMVLVAMAAAGCGVPGDQIARVGGRGVQVTELQGYLTAVTSEPWQDVDPRVATTLLDQYLDQEIVAAAARKRGGEPVPAEPAARSARIRALLREVCGEPPALDAAVVEAETERRLATVRPRRARVRQILLDDRELADEAVRRLEGGESFEVVAGELGRSPEMGAELALVAEGALPPELDEVVFSLVPGEVSAPVQTPAGFHVLEVVEIVPTGPPGRGEAEAAARRDLAERSRRDFMRDCIDRTATELGVTVHSRHLWFEYRGRYAEGSDESS
jgi:hypothetical protein